MNNKFQLKELDKMQIISGVIKLQASGRGNIQREVDVCKMKAIYMIKSNKCFSRISLVLSRYKASLN